MEDEMFRKLALAIFAVASIAAVTPASADGISGEEGVRHRHVEYRWREHHHRDDGYRSRFHRTGYYAGGYGRDYAAAYCYRVVYSEYGPRRIDTPCD
jgi:hypothetical protein